MDADGRRKGVGDSDTGKLAIVADKVATPLLGEIVDGPVVLGAADENPGGTVCMVVSGVNGVEGGESVGGGLGS